jgi:hypothetical protein
VGDLKVADYLVDVEPDSALDYQQALIVAMKREDAAFKMEAVTVVTQGAGKVLALRAGTTVV